MIASNTVYNFSSVASDGEISRFKPPLLPAIHALHLTVKSNPLHRTSPLSFKTEINSMFLKKMGELVSICKALLDYLSGGTSLHRTFIN